MIIPRLINYYDRLTEDGDARVAPYGYNWQKIGFSVVLELDGRVHAIEDRRREVYPTATKKKPNPKPFLKATPMLVPGTEVRTSGIRANLLWDQPSYILGWQPEAKKSKGKKKKDALRIAQECAAFRALHLEREQSINNAGFSAVCRFLERWHFSQLSDESKKIISNGDFGVFQIRGQQCYVHEMPEVKAYWKTQCQSEGNEPLVQSLVSGEMVRATRLHIPIKGVRGANSNGVPLVAFNCPAFESYGKIQGDTAPMSKMEAFKFGISLNILTSSQRAHIDNTTFVYWTGKPAVAESFLGFVFGTQPEDDALREKLRTALMAIARGQIPGEDFGEPETPFYVLGLTGDAGRISVRYWHMSTLADFYERLKRHFHALAIERQYENQPEFPTLWQLLRETVRKDKKSRDKIRRGLPEALLRAILEGTNYPIAIYAAVLRRMRIEGRVSYLKAAIIKAVLERNYEIEAMNDEQQQQPSYRLGRLLAVLEGLQSAAVGSAPINGFFGSASATPGLVFPRLIRGAQPHYAKLRAKKKVGLAIWYERLVEEILEPIATYPSRLTLTEQGLFGLGYYHQRPAIYKKTAMENLEAEDNETKTE
jgi:CRISPR-associated protein Csd1